MYWSKLVERLTLVFFEQVKTGLALTIEQRFGEELRRNRFSREDSMRQGRLLIIGLLACAAILGELHSSPALAQQNWEPTIRTFEQHDKAQPVPPGGIVFTGSSSIARWASLAQDMKPLPVINRGFGGSQYSDVNQYAKRIVVAYRPKIVVVYAGDNDLADGSPKTPESVAGDMQTFAQIVHSQLPETWIYVISIKPSVLRWNAWPKMKEANALIQDFVSKQERVQYIDVATPMFDARGRLPRDLFVEDGLHPTAKLYAMWTAIIKPILSKRFASSAKISAGTFKAVPSLQRGILEPTILFNSVQTRSFPPGAFVT